MAYIRTSTRRDGSTAYHVCYRDPDDGGRQSSKTFDDPNEANLLKQFLDANGQSFRLAEEAVVEMRSAAPTLNAAIKHHLDNLTGIEEGTIAKYRRMVESHVAETIGRRKLDSLTRQDVIGWFNGIDRAPKTKRNVHAVVSSALDTAVDEQWIEKNPAKGVRSSSGSAQSREPVYLTRGEVDQIIARIARNEDEEIRGRVTAFVETLVGTGLRFAEATALRAHVDAKDDGSGRVVLRIGRAWKSAPDGYYLGGPKTKKGRRSVSCSRTLSERLIQHMEDLQPGDLLFGRPDTGAMMRDSHFYQRYWGPTVTRLRSDGELTETPRVHDLRHTHASWLIAKGASPKVVQARMGHEDVRTTFNVYGHLMNTEDAAAADLLD